MSVEVLNEESILAVGGKRKLELCRSFTETGYCVYGDSCFFAHGL